MSADKDTEAFLHDGIVRCYLDAKDAVTTFEAQIQELLKQQLEAKCDSGWTQFHPQQQKRGRGKVVQVGLSQEGGGRQIWACLLDGEGHWIELGIDWGALGGRGPVLYAESHVPGFRKLRLTEPTVKVRSHADGWLYMEFDSPFQLEPMVATLLDATDRAMSNVESAGE